MFSLTTIQLSITKTDSPFKSLIFWEKRHTTMRQVGGVLGIVFHRLLVDAETKIRGPGTSWKQYRRAIVLSTQFIHSSLLTSIRGDHVRSLLSNHVNRTDDKEARNSREYRSIYNAQPLGSMHLKVAR